MSHDCGACSGCRSAGRLLAAAAVLTGLLAAAGCVSPLHPLSAEPARTCNSSSSRCLAEGRTRFEAYRREKIEAIRSRNHGYRLPSAPVAMLHPLRTRYSVLLIHGLNDSPYYMADLGTLLYHLGFNVVTVLLPGHGTTPEDMLEVTAEQWRAEVETGLAMASLVGDKLVIGGMSLGATLAIDAALRRQDIHGLLLFVPALELRSFDAVAGLACAPLVRSAAVVTGIPVNPVKYKRRVGNGVCQLHRLMAHNLEYGSSPQDDAVTTDEKLRGMAARVQVPTFIAMTYADERVSPQAVLEFADHVSAPVLVATFGVPEAGDPAMLANGARIVSVAAENLPHAYLVRRSNPYNGQENPYFQRLAQLLETFVADHFPTKP